MLESETIIDSQSIIVEQLRCVERSLLDRLEGLSAQIQEFSKPKLATVPLKKNAHFEPPTARKSLVDQPKPQGRTLPIDDFNKVSSGSNYSSCDSGSRPVTESSDRGLKRMPFSLDAPKKEESKVWKTIGTKPSEAAKAFVQDALNKAQRKKMKILNKMPSRDEHIPSPRTPRTPLAGIDVVLDLKRDNMNHVASTNTASCWWNPKSENDMWFFNAMKKAEQIKTSVHDLLLSKGWVNQEFQGLSARHNSYREPLSFVGRVAGSPYFEMCCSFMIMLNAALLGYQTQCKAESDGGGEELQWQETTQTVFTIWFASEVLFRMYVWRLNFFVSKDWGWNVFDLVVVSIAVVELVVQLNNTSSAANLSGVRLLRILRLVRVIRFIRVVRFFSELRMMIYSSLRAVRPFLWALTILLLIIYMFSIVTTQSVSDYRLDHPEMNINEMMRFFGSLSESVYTLFMVISGGVSWIQPADELIKVHWSFSIWMSLYVSFVVFAVLNIVTGIFIQSAVQSAQDDQDLVIQEELHHQDSLAQGFLEVFNQCDEDNSGYIDLEEFEKHVSDYRVRAFLHHLGLDVAEAHGLYRLLDIGGCGKVYAKEFVVGCQQLKGPAKNVDVATLLYQNKRMMALWAVFMSYVEDQFGILLNGHIEGTVGLVSNRGSRTVDVTSGIASRPNRTTSHAIDGTVSAVTARSARPTEIEI